MISEACVYEDCTEPRDRGASTYHPFKGHIKDGSPPDMSECDELLSPPPIPHSDSKLCAACRNSREEGANQARIAIGEKAGAEGLQEELAEQLCTELRSLADHRKEPHGQAAFDGFLSVASGRWTDPEK